jgi:hypothetical protein
MRPGLLTNEAVMLNILRLPQVEEYSLSGADTRLRRR